MSEVAKISERIRRLLELTKSDNAHEAASAATRAQALMQEHRLTEFDVTEATNDGELVTEIPMGAEGFMASWKFALVSNVARAFFCEAIGLHVGKKRKVRIVGRREDAEAAVEVFTFLMKEIERLAERVTPDDHDDNDAWDGDLLDLFEKILGDAVDIRAYRDKWRQGAAKGAADKLKAERARFAKSSERALMVVRKSEDEIDLYLAKKYDKTTQRIVDPSIKLRPNEEVAFEKGYVAGVSITVPGSSEPKRIENVSEEKIEKNGD